MNAIELNVKGMSCGHCVTAVTQALLAVPGVLHADVSLTNSHAHVEHDGTSTLASMVSAVEEEGFAASLAESDPEA